MIFRLIFVSAFIILFRLFPFSHFRYIVVHCALTSSVVLPVLKFSPVSVFLFCLIIYVQQRVFRNHFFRLPYSCFFHPMTLLLSYFAPGLSGTLHTLRHVLLNISLSNCMENFPFTHVSFLSPGLFTFSKHLVLQPVLFVLMYCLAQSFVYFPLKGLLLL